MKSEKIYVTSYVGFFEEANGEYYVSVWVDEDKVSAPQNGHPDNAPEHRHVLRTATDKHAVFGVELDNGTIKANTRFENEHVADFPTSEWNKDNITVTVVVWEKVSNSIYKVVNASNAIYQE